MIWDLSHSNHYNHRYEQMEIRVAAGLITGGGTACADEYCVVGDDDIAGEGHGGGGPSALSDAFFGGSREEGVDA